MEAAGKAFDAWERTSPTQKRTIFLKAVALMQTDKYKDKIKKALWDETAAPKELLMVNVMGGVTALLEAASLASQVKGTAFPSTFAPGGHVIVQRRAHGAV